MPELLDLAERVVGSARPGEQVEAFVGWHRETEARAYAGALESLTTAEGAGIGVRVIVDQRQGFAYSASLDEADARECLETARDNARFSTPDEFLGLADPDGTAPAAIEAWDDALGTVSNEEKIDLALELDRRARSADRRIRKVVESDYSDGASESAIASSTGIRATSRRTSCFASTYVLAGDGDESQSGGSYSGGRGPSSLDLEFVARDAAARATRLLGARKPASATIDAVFDARMCATLLGLLGRVLAGDEAHKGRSLFAGRLGEQVVAPTLTLVDDPTDVRAFGATAVDAEGLACRRNVLLDDGVLRGFLYDSYSARRAGTASTASAVRAGFKSTPGVGARALSLRPGSGDFASIVAGIEDGLYVQSVLGLHSGVNLVSGDFSVGAEGVRIRDGELAEPVREVTIASSIQRMLSQVIALGGDVEWLPAGASGMTIALGGLSMSGA